VNPVIVISNRDNVATALEALDAGRTIEIGGGMAVTVLEAVPRGHKLALRAIEVGEPVVKYGSPIGTASAAIPPGAHVHTHNVASTRGRGDLVRPSISAPVDEARIAEPPDDRTDPPEHQGSAGAGPERRES
jgi:altronate hydrolase